MVSRTLFAIIFSLCVIPNALAFSLFGESVPVLPDEGLGAEGRKEWQRAISIYLDDLLVSPNRVDLWLRIASIEHQLKNFSLSIDAYNHAVSIQPNNAHLYKTLSEIYAELNRPTDAMDSINKALLIDPNNIQYLNAKAMFASWLKNEKLAIQTYESILNLSPNNKSALNAMSLIQHQMSQQINGMKPQSPFDYFINEANNAAMLHHYTHASAAMQKAIALKPLDPSLFKKLSEIYASAKKPQLALDAINRAVIIAPTQIEYWRARAKIAAWAGDKLVTKESYERILKLKPYDQDAMLNLAHVLAWRAETDNALCAYRQFLKIYPKIAEGWIQYAEVLSWIGDYLGALDALKHYRQLRGETAQYLETMARVLALVGRFKSALAINDPLLSTAPNDLYRLITEVTALTSARQIINAVNYLGKANDIGPNDPLVKGLNDVTLTPIRSNINFEADYTAASDTTRILDLPISAQYFLTPATSLLAQGLYERASASVTSGLQSTNGNSSISDESAMFGFTTQALSTNVRAVLGGLTIQGENNHVIYDASLNRSLTEKAQISVATLHNLFRPYLVPQTPRLISLQVMETRYGGLLQWQPFVEKYLNVLMSYSNLSDDNSYTHLNLWPKARVYASQHWLVSLGVDGDFWQFRRRASDGYYSPLHFDGYEGTIELYYAQSENIGYGFSGGFGLQKDETFPHYFYEEDISAQMFLGIFTDWALQVKGGLTKRDNPIKNYLCWSTGLTLTRRF